VLSPSSLSFENTVSTKTIAVSDIVGGYTWTVAAGTGISWATPTKSGNNISVAVTANSGAARNGSIILTLKQSSTVIDTITIPISQAGV
jgi:hypothetical protein